MIALREGAKELNHEHFHGGILEVAAKKKSDHFVSPVDGRLWVMLIQSSSVLCLDGSRISVSSADGGEVMSSLYRTISANQYDDIDQAPGLWIFSLHLCLTLSLYRFLSVQSLALSLLLTVSIVSHSATFPVSLAGLAELSLSSSPSRTLERPLISVLKPWGDVAAWSISLVSCS
jgi:hypothetical protein